jgi:hypothetical protein
MSADDHLQPDQFDGWGESTYKSTRKPAQQARAGREARQAAAGAAPAYWQRGHKPSGHGKNNTVARCPNCLPRDTKETTT